jgi:glycine cleavage system H protein
MLKSTYKLKMEDTAVEEPIAKVGELTFQCEGKRICVKTDRRYTRKHIWAKKTIEGNFKVGVTDYAQQSLREKVALLEIFKNSTVGDEVEAGEVFGVVYGKLYANLCTMQYEYMAFDLTAPVNGKIIEVNRRVMETPQLINISPYKEGWIAIIAPTPESDLSDLITPMKYKQILTKKDSSPFRVI